MASEIGVGRPRPRFPWSTRSYRLLLRLLPGSFRRRFADDLSADFETLLSEATRGRPLFGWIRCWSEILLDLAGAVPREHWRVWRSPYDQRRLAARSSQSERTHFRRFTVRSILFDLRHALRALRRAPVFSLVTVIILALGIGANTAIFTLVRAVLLRPLPFEQPDRLVLMHESLPAMNFPIFPFSAPDYLDLERQQEVFADLGAFVVKRVELSGVETPETVDSASMSSSLFTTLGVEPALGRVWSPQEDAPGHDVLVLDYDFWQERFAGSPDVLGSTIRLDRDPYTVIGVMPASFDFPPRGLPVNGQPASLFTPTAWEPFQLENRGMMHNLSAIARLADGVTLERARADLETIADRVQDAYGAAGRAPGVELSFPITPLRDAVVGEVRTPLLLLLGAVGLVLLVVVANVANLTLSRAAARQSEMAIRAAIGAGRGRLIQSLLLESLLLAGLGAALGVALAQLAVRLAIRLLPGAIPFSERVRLDLPVLLFTLGLTVLTAVLCGAAPLFAAGRRRLEALLRSAVGRSTGSAARQRLQRVLVVTTVALALVLLVGAGLLGRSFNRLIGTEAGFDADRVLTMALTLPPEAYPEAEGVRSFVRTLRERVAALAGVEHTSMTTSLPLTFGERRSFYPEGADPTAVRPSVTVTWVDGPFFEALGIPLEEGRLFDGSERADGEQVVLVNRTLARRIWPEEDVVGQRIRWRMPGSENAWLTVIGVVADVNDGPLGSEPNPHVYVPYQQFADAELDMAANVRSPWGRQFQLVVASETDPSSLINPVLAEVRELDRSLPVSAVRTMEQIVGEGVAPQRASALLLGAFAAIALVLAGVGLYGVLAYAVTQRRREIGVRVALGAERSSVVGMIVRQGLGLVLVGLAGGVIAALGLSRLMAAVLYQTAAWDPVTFVAATAVLVLAALLASWLPARRASRVDPATALRTE
ncbi:MAG TPA: ABC transporter permease [Thermoanaerobaculia bacterium]|nr:ABC transporter permease [Thermoanaerobaculia bacterium]